MNSPRNFRQYKVWQDAVQFAVEVYKVSSSMPWFEKKGISDQIQRASVSISSNIAEGSARPSDTDFSRFLYIALGSAYEVETQLKICKEIKYVDEDRYNKFLSEIQQIERQICGLINSLK